MRRSVQQSETPWGSGRGLFLPRPARCAAVLRSLLGRLLSATGFRALALWGLTLLAVSGAAAALQTPALPTPTPLREGQRAVLEGGLFAAQDRAFPERTEDIAGWLRGKTPVSRVNLSGGQYWLVQATTNASGQSEWVFNPHGTLMDEVETRVYRSGQPTVRELTGYRHEHEYTLHYGQDLELGPGETVWLVVYVRSPYFASYPDFSLDPAPAYRKQVHLENLLTLAALGALLSLAIYNLFVFVGTRDRSLLLYALYLLTYCVAWAFTFHIFADVFGFRNLHLHYVWFFLLPVTNTLFYRRFLRLDEHLPRLARLSRVNLWLPLALLPSCFVALPYANALATLAITVWLVLALISGVASWRRGFTPARYFVFGLLALLIPAALILPGNVGLLPDLVENSELFTLLGGTLDGLLLAFALADRIRLLMRDNETYIARLQEALHLAGTDGLTGLRNRHAFDQAFSAAEARGFSLLLIDLDGLKKINDSQGHHRGDELLRAFARLLGGLDGEGTSTYRLGGDEFAVIAPLGAGDRLRHELGVLEQQLRALGFPEAGVSFGLATHGESPSRGEVFSRADQRMYEHKQAKKGRVHRTWT